MSHRILHTVVSRVRAEQDRMDWEPIPEPGFGVTIRSDKGQETVRSFLCRIYQNVMIKLVLEVEMMPAHRDYVFRVW